MPLFAVKGSECDHFCLVPAVRRFCQTLALPRTGLSRGNRLLVVRNTSGERKKTRYVVGSCMLRMVDECFCCHASARRAVQTVLDAAHIAGFTLPPGIDR